MPHPLGYQLAHGAPAAGRLDFEAPVQGLVEINGGFHESKLPILLGNVKLGRRAARLGPPAVAIAEEFAFSCETHPG